MLVPHASDTMHRAWLYRLLSAIADDRELMRSLRFKGGTYAALRGLLNRFSVDLDFDLLDSGEIPQTKKKLEKIFMEVGLEIKDQSKEVPQYFLRYPAKSGERNTIEVDVTCPPPRSNTYEVIRLADIDRFLPCHTIETMFANKLVTPLDRFRKHGSIAGRDIYDIHAFLLQDLPFSEDVIRERSGFELPDFLGRLIKFIEDKVTQTVIDQDLNLLLPADQFRRMRKILKQETIMILNKRIK